MEDSSEDEEVETLCAEMGIKIRVKPVTIPKSNMENLDINNLPFSILNDDGTIEDLIQPSDLGIVPHKNELNLVERWSSPINQEETVTVQEIHADIHAPATQTAQEIVEKDWLNSVNNVGDSIVEPMYLTETFVEESPIENYVTGPESPSTATFIVESPIENDLAGPASPSIFEANEYGSEQLNLDFQNDVDGDIIMEDIEYHGELTSNRKRKSKGCSDSREWDRNICKRKRLEGEEYMGYRRQPTLSNKNKEGDKDDKADRRVEKRKKKNKQKDKRDIGDHGNSEKAQKKFKVFHDVIRPARSLGPKCKSKFCEKSKLRGCTSLSDEERKRLFQQFWKKMSWEQRQQYIISHVEITKKKQTKNTSETSRRTSSKNYFLSTTEGRIQVCMRSFLSVFGIKEWTVRYWLEKVTDGMAVKSDVAHKRIEGSLKVEQIEFLKEFLQSLPKMPSHYCRATTTRQYLEPIVENKSHLYNIYVTKCREMNRDCVSRHTFDRVFAQTNLSFFQRKKDQCDTCCAFKVGNVTKEDYEKHVAKKQAARDEKDQDKALGLAKKVHVFTHDLQSVKLCPQLEASALYFKTKLCVHNFTMNNLETKDVHCYWFDESNGGLVSSVFTSCIVDCLKKTLAESLRPVIMFSDGCTAQNRNVVLANALLQLAMEYKVPITQKFLEKGHTQMECDSSHSAIECKVKGKEIFLPSQYATISKTARPKQPFIVNHLSYNFFEDYSDRQDFVYDSIRPGRVANDPTVTDLRVLHYDPLGVISYKLDYKEKSFSEMPKRRNTKILREISLRPKLYQNRIKITDTKYKHLQELKSVIPADCHDFYNNLPHN